jgi:hypothetical protein
VWYRRSLEILKMSYFTRSAGIGAICLTISSPSFAVNDSLSFHQAPSGHILAVATGDAVPGCTTAFALAPSSITISGNNIAIVSPAVNNPNCFLPPPFQPYQTTADLGVLTLAAYDVTWTAGPFVLFGELLPTALTMVSLPTLSHAALVVLLLSILAAAGCLPWPSRQMGAKTPSTSD